ncbi:unnamed protein product [Rhizopus stolonifer]
MINDILKPIFSLRSTLALDGFDFVSELGNHLGAKLHLNTIETIIVSLVKCCSTSNKIIFNKANKVAISFLQKTRLSTRVVVILCKTIDDKNNQVRQSAVEFLKTLLTIHARKLQGNSSASIQKYIKKGLTDASPEVRESCRQAYWVYYEHWPKEAEKICLKMDSSTLKQLKASQKKEKLPLTSRPNSFPTAPQKNLKTNKASLKRSSPALERTKISRKATEELRPEEEVKKRYISEEPEQVPVLNVPSKSEEEIKKTHASKEPEKTLTANDSSKHEEESKNVHVPERTYNPLLDNLNQVARTNLDNIQKGIERMKAGDVDVSLLCDLQIV